MKKPSDPRPTKCRTLLQEESPDLYLNETFDGKLRPFLFMKLEITVELDKL
jgi:hypothetical protein